ncbi:putative ADAMTS-like protein 5 [Apostichopus japonicus]|uniref:Putative ADAMTS-like protein 5 n=1 Tax=Stichopus japonicus TaxID=307972 RepID=A0A2G8LJ11_STIJA|nr:putative ADAMTS-like protein 5 [Apostichopus japonicus]
MDPYLDPCPRHGPMDPDMDTDIDPDMEPDINTEMDPDMDMAAILVGKGGYIPHENGWRGSNDGCNLLCEKNVDATNTISRNLGVVVDGTQCKKNNGGGVCIKGQCRSVGCDNQLDSLMRYDSCGECGGTNHSCGSFQGHSQPIERSIDGSPIYSGHVWCLFPFQWTELFHYYDVLTFQPGTTNITVEEASDVNYLAVSVNDRFYLNGNWAVNHPGTFTVAGAPFTYQRRRDGYEKITSPGPVNSVVQISIIVRTENPVVIYEYYVPPMQHEQPEVPTDLGNTIGSNTAIVDEPVHNPLVPVVDETVTEKDNSQEDKTESAKKSDKSEKSKTKNKKKKPGRQQKEPKKKMKKPTKQEVKELCGPCARVKGKVRNFCHSDFVVHAMILDRMVGTNMTRYDVQILQTFTNKVMLFSREYIWVPNVCQCPRLKIGRDYLIMGDRVQSANTRENLLMVDRDKMVVRWNPTKFDLWDSIQSTSNAKCYKLLKKESKKSRRD